MQTIIVVTEQTVIDPLAGPHTIYEEILSNLQSVGVDPVSITTHPGDVTEILKEPHADVSQLRADIAEWQTAGLSAAIEILTSKTGSDTMRAFTKHHERLLGILAKHKLISGHAVESATVEVVNAVVDVHAAADPRD